MSTLDKLAVDHPYYCSENNYYSNEASMRYETMTEFLDDFEGADEYLNLCFRWDIKPRGENGSKYGRYRAEVFLMLQRKGIFKPVQIEHINEAEADRFKEYAQRHWALLRSMWEPISESSQCSA